MRTQRQRASRGRSDDGSMRRFILAGKIEIRIGSTTPRVADPLPNLEMLIFSLLKLTDATPSCENVGEPRHLSPVSQGYQKRVSSHCSAYSLTLFLEHCGTNFSFLEEIRCLAQTSVGIKTWEFSLSCVNPSATRCSGVQGTARCAEHVPAAVSGNTVNLSTFSKAKPHLRKVKENWKNNRDLKELLSDLA